MQPLYLTNPMVSRRQTLSSQGAYRLQMISVRFRCGHLSSLIDKRLVTKGSSWHSQAPLKRGSGMVDYKRTAYHKRNTCNTGFHQNQLKIRQKHPFNLSGVHYFQLLLYSWRIIPVINHSAKAKDDTQICGAKNSIS